MCREYQNLRISPRENTQNTHMIEQIKSNVCLAEKGKSSRPDVVHTRSDDMLSDKRSTEPSTSGRKNMSVRTLHIRS
jgi:hypothetical protein